MRIFDTVTAADVCRFGLRRARARVTGRRNAHIAAALAAALTMALPAAALAGAFPAELNLSTLDGKNGFSMRGYSGGRGDISVSGAGDVNGDGYADFIMGAFYGSGYVVFGTDQGFPAELAVSALDGTNGFTLNGINGDGRFSVAGAGDVNGDGIDDVVVAAPQTMGAYVLFGTDQGFPAVFDLSTLDGDSGFVVSTGSYDVYSASYTVSGAGDVNGDGYGDIIVGYACSEPNCLGKAYLIFGSGQGFVSPVDVDALDGSNGFIIEGVDHFSQLGTSVSGAGDFNGDGIDDIIVGTRGLIDLPTGDSFVVFGSNQGFPAVLRVSELDGGNGVRIFGSPAFTDHHVSDAGDVNGDGIGDVIIGAPDDNYPYGRSYVLFGARGGLSAQLHVSTLNGANGFALNGVIPDGRAGYTVSGAGDINGDGIADIVVGTYFTSQSYVVFGTDLGFPAQIELSALDGRIGFTLKGVSQYSLAGITVSEAGDVNGDGVDDVVIGDPFASEFGFFGTVYAYVVYGRRVPGLTVSGACPGTVTVEVTRATPGATLGLVSALVEGSYAIPSGACAGAVLDLDNPALYTTLTADATGGAAASATVPSSACGRVLQVIDAATCTPSNVAAVP